MHKHLQMLYGPHSVTEDNSNSCKYYFGSEQCSNGQTHYYDFSFKVSWTLLCGTTIRIAHMSRYSFHLPLSFEAGKTRVEIFLKRHVDKSAPKALMIVQMHFFFYSSPVSYYRVIALLHLPGSSCQKERRTPEHSCSHQQVQYSLLPKAMWQPQTMKWNPNSGCLPQDFVANHLCYIRGCK